MLTGLKMSSLVCRRIFYGSEHNAKWEPMNMNFEGLEIRIWNILTDRAQKVDEKNEVTCIATMFTPRVMVIKMSKMAYFLFFLLTTDKRISHSFDKIFQSILKILFRSFRKCYGLWHSELTLARCQP